MSKEFDDIYKKINQSNRDLYKQDSEIIKNITNVGKDQDKIIKDISEIKKEVKDIAFKVDTMLEILNSFSLMLVEDDEDLEENYSDDESWVPEQEEDWNSYEDDEDI